MDIKDKITPEEKQQIGGLVIECQVLNNLLQERNAMLESKVKEILTKNGISPQLYNLIFNPSQDLWRAELKEEALIIPNQETRRAVEKRKN